LLILEIKDSLKYNQELMGGTARSESDEKVPA
jgi:hypothetical protein